MKKRHMFPSAVCYVIWHRQLDACGDVFFICQNNVSDFRVRSIIGVIKIEVFSK